MAVGKEALIKEIDEERGNNHRHRNENKHPESTMSAFGKPTTFGLNFCLISLLSCSCITEVMPTYLETHGMLFSCFHVIS